MGYIYHGGITKPTYLENVIAVCVEYHNALVEVVVLHGTRAVKNSQGRFSLSLEGIIRAPMVQVVTETGHEQPQDLQVVHKPFHLARLEHGEHRLCYI